MTNEPSETTRVEIINTLVTAGDRLIECGDVSDAGAIYRQAHEMAARLSATDAKNVKWQTLSLLAQHKVAYVMAEEHRHAEAIALLDDMVGRLGDSNEAALSELLKKILLNKARVLRRAGDNEAALETYDKIIALYYDNPEAVAPDEWLGKAILSKANTLTAIGKTEQALIAYDELIGAHARRRSDKHGNVGKRQGATCPPRPEDEVP